MKKKGLNFQGLAAEIKYIEFLTVLYNKRIFHRKSMEREYLISSGPCTYLLRKNYLEKFITLTKDFITRTESERFLETVQNLRDLKSKQLDQLNIKVLDQIQNIRRKKIAIFYLDLKTL